MLNIKRKYIVLLIGFIIFSLLLYKPVTMAISKKDQSLVANDHVIRSVESEIKNRVAPYFVQASFKSLETSLAQNETLQQKVNGILEDPLREGALVGISVRKATDETLVYEHMGNVNLHPASNMKLLTGAAALEVLGPDYQFTTEVWTDGKIKDGTLDGHLYVKGKGDPTLLEKDLIQFAKEIKAKGIQKISGNLIGDDTWYDDVRYSQDLNWSDEYNYTGAAVSALTISPNEDYDAGTVILNVKGASKVGESPQVTISPETDFVTIVNKAETVSSSDVNGITVEREHGTNNLIVEGTIGVGSSMEAWRAVWEPTLFTIHILKKALTDQGITVEGRIDRNVTPQKAELLISRKSIPLKELMVPFMKLSNNGHGEILVKEMGKVTNGEGSWDEGLKVMKEQLAKLGIDPESLLIRDGSGMSHKNLIKPNDLSKLLFHIQEQSWFPEFKASQPVAGDQERMVGGSLTHRMKEAPLKGNVQAKTGSLTGVNTLSGYATTKSGEEIIFSVMINNYIDGYMPRVIDEIVGVIVEEL